MKYALLLLFPFIASGQMTVQTVVSNEGSTEGIWLDGHCNIFFTTGRVVKKINAMSGAISIIAGTSSTSTGGDGSPATNVQILPYGLYSDESGTVYIAEPDNNRVRRVDASTGIITTFAGGGATSGDNGAATNAQLNFPANVYGDKEGNIYVAEKARIRKISKSGLITTIAGTGIVGLSGDGGPATNSQINYVQGMISDDRGNFYFADRLNHRIRKIDSKGIVTTYAGTSDGFSGDGGPATAAQLSGPISFVIDYTGSMVIGDNQNNVLRRVNANTGIITTIAGVHGGGSLANNIPATTAEIHPEFMYLDRSGNIYYSCFCQQIRKVTGYLPCLPNNGNSCGETAIPIVHAGEEYVKMYPNPAGDELHVKIVSGIYQALTIMNSTGQVVLQQTIITTETEVPVGILPAGMYYASLRGSGGVVVKRFVKE